ncbi:uncharacterized protein LOC113848299 [Abrus precatorius]|uniref:Uncharacterized protein LOC113848299 n=1 Tax=Abrus precatorius TaxID=3816 RepID=A0A8B8JPW5_ABRPR|nr:uncharacterized protein LOC113848299 [Abrus precatorius]
MDEFMNPYSEVHNQLLSHNSKRIMKFLLKCSLFCALFSVLLPLHLHSLKPFLMQFYSYTVVDKTYIFLLCNGLLLLIAMSSSPPTTHQTIQRPIPIHIEKSTQLEFNVSCIEAPVAAENVDETESPQEEEKVLTIAEQENAVSDTQEEDKEERNALVKIDEHEHSADDTEELNKKCEDFIKRMKASFSEPRADYSFYYNNQKSLVVVN